MGKHWRHSGNSPPKNDGATILGKLCSRHKVICEEDWTAPVDPRRTFMLTFDILIAHPGKYNYCIGELFIMEAKEL